MVLYKYGLYIKIFAMKCPYKNTAFIFKAFVKNSIEKKATFAKKKKNTSCQ